MLPLISRFVVLSCALALTACTTMNVVSDRASAAAPDPVALTKSVHADDQVRITTLDGTVHALRLTSVSETEVTGVQAGSPVATSIPAPQIGRIERREVAPGKTFLLVLGVAGTIALVVLAVEATAGRGRAVVLGAHVVDRQTGKRARSLKVPPRPGHARDAPGAKCGAESRA